MKKIAAAIALAAAALGVQAATVSYSFGSPTLGLQTTNINQTGNLSYFDSSLGTLTDVVLTLYGTAVTNITLSNQASQQQTATATSTVDLTFNVPSFLTGAVPVPALSLMLSTGSQTLAAGASTSVGPIAQSKNLVLDAALDSFIASFARAGGGSFALNCTSESGLGVTGGGGNIGAGQRTQAACGASITYTFATVPQQIPEPASLALVGLALAAAGIAARRSLKS